MKTLNEWNIEQYRKLRNMQNQPLPAAVACDVCGNEMLQTNDDTMLASNPPKQVVWCLCGYTAYKVI